MALIRRWEAHVIWTDWAVGVWWSKNHLTSRYSYGFQVGPVMCNYSYRSLLSR